MDGNQLNAEPAKRPGGADGFSLLESLLATLLVGAAALPLLDAMARSQTVRLHREIRLSAERLLDAEAERLSSRSGFGVLEPNLKISANGVPSAEGDFSVRYERAESCAGSSGVGNRAGEPQHECERETSIATYRLVVKFSTPLRRSGEDSVSTTLTVGHTGRRLTAAEDP